MNSSLKRSCEKVARSVILNLQENCWKHVSFITDKNSIISVGWNHPFKTHPLANKFGYRYDSIHAELHAILNFEYPVKELCNYKLVNIRIDKFGKMKLSKPCKICQILLRSFAINEIWYTDSHGNFKEL